MKTRVVVVAACALAIGVVAAPAWAGGRGRTNPAWLETQNLADTVRQSPHPTADELAELERRMAPLAADQRRLLSEAYWLDAEETWLVAASKHIDDGKAEFARRCSEITDESQLAACRDLVEHVNGDVNAYNPRYLSFAPREERYRNEVTAWMASLAEMRTWMRGLLARRPVTAQERTLLEREREALRADVAGIQEALRRLEAQRTTSDEERADWEKRYGEATARARARLKEYLADESFEAAQRLLSMCSSRLTKDIRLKIDKRINLAGGNDPDKERLVKELDAQIKDLVTQRSEVDSAGPALSTAWDAVKKAEAALEPGEEDGSKAEKALEEMRDVVGDALGNPAVQRALRLSEVPALVFTFGKLIADASFDITTELLAFARIGQMDREADAYLEAVAHLDEQMKKKVARLQEIERALGASQ